MSSHQIPHFARIQAIIPILRFERTSPTVLCPRNLFKTQSVSKVQRMSRITVDLEVALWAFAHIVRKARKTPAARHHRREPDAQMLQSQVVSVPYLCPLERPQWRRLRLAKQVKQLQAHHHPERVQPVEPHPRGFLGPQLLLLSSVV